MSENHPFGFAKLVPGFDFLQNIAKGTSQNIPQLPNLSNWIAPTLNVEELDKRITELKAVHYWLEQNGKALGATIQALEVQKMTLATLQGMNMKMGEVADALRLEPAAAGAGTGKEPAENPVAMPKKAGQAADAASAKPKSAGAVDPLQWWGSLTQQFQAIAANAMQDATQQATLDGAGRMASGAAQAPVAAKTAKPPTKAAKAASKKPPARKAAPAKARSRN